MKTKIFKYYLVLIVVVLITTVIFTTHLSKKYYKAEVENKLESIGLSIEYSLLQTDASSRIDYDKLAKDFAANYNQYHFHK